MGPSAKKANADDREGGPRLEKKFIEGIDTDERRPIFEKCTAIKTPVFEPLRPPAFGVFLLRHHRPPSNSSVATQQGYRRSSIMKFCVP